ncbi:UNKNOWN [Stylonychia lemnae]|uniref:Transmembrane protein n=1 Tax=Stylonychia lemnae TaxID=5949 RepID=A0A078AYG5_STYLE|nr:UNKNOWN [Stylonychia lemnae]|eukprot:CDW87176.1 UNKNOWN [Stylonychia lemnae]
MLSSSLNYIRSFDIYGHQVKILYKGEDTKKTLVGSILSIVSIGLMAWYFVTQLQDIIENKSSVKQTQNPIEPAKALINITSSNFDAAFMFYNSKQNYDYVEMQQYMQINTYFKRDGFYYDEYNEEIRAMNEIVTTPFEKCDKDRMFNSTVFQNYMQYRNDGIFYCYNKDLNQKLEGSDNTLRFEITKCEQKTLSKDYPQLQCVTDQNELQQFFENLQVLVFSSQQYFDVDEFEADPIKFMIDVEKATISPKGRTSLTYDMLLNKVSGSDNKLHENLNQFEKSFISTKIRGTKTSDIQKDDDSYEVLFDVIFKVQNELRTIERQANNFVQALSNVGGLSGIIFGLIAILIAPLQEFFFYQSLLKSSFLVEQSKIKKEEDKLETDDSQNSDKVQIKEQIKKKDFNTYLRLIVKLKDRVKFYYPLGLAIKQWFQQIFRCCCKRRRYQKELYELGKDVIEKQLDVQTIIQDLRSFKMINNVLLSKFQRQLIPYFKRYLLTQKLERVQIKEAIKEIKDKKPQDDQKADQVTQLMIELFGNSKNPQSVYNDLVIDRVFLDKEDNLKDLKTQLFTGILRKFIGLNLDNNYDDQRDIFGIYEPPALGIAIHDQDNQENLNATDGNNQTAGNPLDKDDGTRTQDRMQ